MRLILIPLVVFALLFAPVAPAKAVTDEEVGKAIDKLKQYILSQQQRDGSFAGEHAGQQTGLSALMVLSLLVAGESPQRPEIARALEFIADTEPGTPDPIPTDKEGKPIPVKRTDSAAKPKTNGTYALGVRCHVWAALPQEYQRFLEKDASYLLTQNHNGTGGFHYAAGQKSYDNSTTQYGVLGVWEAAKRGGRIPTEFWTKVAEHFIRTQNKDGGWQYSGGGSEAAASSSTLAMTAAGLTGMFIVQQQLFGGAGSQVPPKIQDAIAAGLEWMDTKYAPVGNMYAMYGVERVALASGFKHFNQRDWYQSGADVIVKSGGGGGYSSAFALLFLARGRYPVWVSKLAVPDYPWNNRPNDLQYVTRYISDMREGEFNWQVIRLESPVQDWLSTPMVYLTSDRALKLDAPAKERIKSFLDLGGLLVVNPEKRSAEMTKSIKELAKELYPQYPPKKLPPNHQLYRSLYPIERTSEDIQTVSNGARDLILITGRDWSGEFQGMGYDYSQSGASVTDLNKLVMNLWTIVTDRGTIAPRLVECEIANSLVIPPAKEATLTVPVARVKYNGDWLPEPGAWQAGALAVQRKSGVKAVVKDVELAQIDKSDAVLAHLTGVDGATFSQEELGALKRFADNGGTVLVESVGGRGEFSAQVEAQMLKEFNLLPKPMYSSGDPIITGENLPPGGSSCKHVVYRRDLVLTGVGNAPRLVAIYIKDRPAVIFSREDLSLGMLSFRQSGIFGYTPDSSVKLMSNILLAASRRGAPPPAPKPEPAPAG